MPNHDLPFPDRFLRRFLSTALVLLAAGAPAFAAAGRWSPYGPPEGSLVTLAFGPGGNLFLAAEESGVYASRDGGRTWGWSGTGIGSDRIRVLAGDAASRTLFAVSDTRAFRSADGGATWQLLAQRLELGASPAGGDVLAVGPGATGDLFLARDNRLYRGDSGGAGAAAWHQVLTTDSPILSLLVDPANSRSVFAGTASPGALLHSADGGTSWATVNDVESLPGPPLRNPFSENVQQLSALPGRPGVLLANSAASAYISKDSGASWRHIRAVPAGAEVSVISLVGGAGPRGRTPSIYALFQLRSNDGFGHFALFASRDLGATWSAEDDGSGPFGSLRVDPATGALAALSIDGVGRTDGSGGPWRTSLIGSQLCGAAVVAPPGTLVRFPPTSPSRVYVASGGRLFASDDAGATWRAPAAALSGAPQCIEIHDVAIDPRNETHLFATTDRGIYTSGDAGESWQQQSNDGIGSVLAVLPRGGLLSGGCGIQRSIDGGRHWSQRLDCELPDFGGDSGLDVRRLVVDGVRPGAIYAGTVGESGRVPPQFFPAVFRSLDNGITWSDLFDGSGVFAFDPRTPKTLYVLAPDGVRKSVDDGLTWTLISGFALLDPIFGIELQGDLRVDPIDPHILWAARTDGVWRSFDSGVSWSSPSNGLQGRPATGLFTDPHRPGRWIVTTGAGTFIATFPPIP